MSSEPGLGRAFAGLDGLCKAEVWPLGVGKVRERPSRMEAIYYGSDGYQALEALRNSHLETCRLGELTAVVWPGVFARRFVPDPERGVPFLSTSAMMEAKPKARQFLSIKNTRNLSAYLVREGTILVSRSGTVGNVALVTKDLAGHAVSEDALRVHVRDPVDLGAVYCYLQSALGQFLLKRSQTGSVVRHLYEADVANLPIPKLPLELRRDLTERIRKVSALRVEANRLLDEADKEIFALCGGPEREAAQQSLHIGVVTSGEIEDGDHYRGAVRLDANPISPVTNRLRAAITQGTTKKLQQLVEEIIYIGKVYRIPLDDEAHSIPLLAGKDLVRIRPSEQRRISILNKDHIERCSLKRGWVLISRAGTCGRVSVVHRNYEGHIGSEDILRIVPKASSVDPYYLAAYLGSFAGQTLVDSLVYGSVIFHISKAQLGTIPVLVPADGGDCIGEKVKLAYDHRADAIGMENSAIKTMQAAISAGFHIASVD